MKRNLHAGRQLSSGLSLNILTDDELDEIHYGTLEVLNETGVFVESEKARDCFEEGGAVVNRDTKIVKISPHIVEDAIRSAPSKVVPFLLKHRYLMIAIALNLPGNALIGGGGGIGLISGMSGLYPFPKYILLVSFAITPLPLLLLAGKLPV